MRQKRFLQSLVAALGALGATKTEVLQARLGTRPATQSDKRRS
jgi:hypothetical protein